ncbi:hypothetical protein [Thalassotalea ganghwensis]
MKHYILLIAFATSGCAVPYKQPLQTEPHATIEVVHKTTSFPSSTTVNVFSDSLCRKEGHLGRLASLGKAYDLDEKPVTSLIKPESKVYLAFDGWTQESAGYFEDGRFVSHINKTCVNLISFTPQKGDKYTAYQLVTNRNQCEVVLIKESSGKSPENLEYLQAVKSCSAYCALNDDNKKCPPE